MESLADRRKARRPVIGEDDMATSALDKLKASLDVVDEGQEDDEEEDVFKTPHRPGLTNLPTINEESNEKRSPMFGSVVET